MLISSLIYNEELGYVFPSATSLGHSGSGHSGSMISDVRAVLPKPDACGTTQRTQGMLKFNVNFDGIVIS